MSGMKTLIIVNLIALICILSPVQSAGNKTWSEEDLLSDFGRALDLDKNQLSKMRPKMSDLTDDMTSLVDKYREEGMIGLLSLRSDVELFVRDSIDIFDDILTDEQKNMLKDSNVFKASIRDKVQDGFKEGVFTDISEMLKLSDDVGNKFRSVLEKDFDQRKDLLKQYEQSSDSTIKKLRSFLDGNANIAEKSLDSLENILTGDQLEQLKKMNDDLLGNIKKKIVPSDKKRFGRK